MATTRRRLDPAQRRAQLLEIGSRLFAERPYDEVWIEEVAEVAEVSRGLLYHYFPNKRDFFAAVVQHESDQLLKLTDPGPDLPIPQRLAAGLDAYIAYVDAHEHGFRALHRGAASVDAGIRAILERGFDVQQQRILGALESAAPVSEVMRVAVRAWLAFVVSACLDWLDRRTITRDELRDICAATLLSAVGQSAS